MIRKILKSYLDIQDLEKELSQHEERIDQVHQGHEELEENLQELQETVKENTSRIRDLEPISVDLTDRQRDVLEVFLQTEKNWLDVHSISEVLNTSRNNAGSIMSDLKKKVEFDVKTVDNGKKMYQLPQTEKKKIFQNNV
jgi:chromosome segregation ATPase